MYESSFTASEPSACRPPTLIRAKVGVGVALLRGNAHFRGRWMIVELNPERLQQLYMARSMVSVPLSNILLIERP
jgi:hypothetical protein